MTLKRMLIIGGSGFIGYHLAKKSIKKNWKIDSISTHEPKKKRFLKNVKYIKCDITNLKKLQKKITKNYSFVVNLGGYVDHFNKLKTYKSHYIGCKNLADIFLKKKIQNFIQMGSGGEYFKCKSPQFESQFMQPISPYAKAKFLATKYLMNLNKKKKFPITVLRLYQAYGAKQDVNRLIPIVITSCLQDKNFPCSDGNQLRDFIHIDDVTNAILKCYKNKKVIGEIINIGSGKPTKVKTLINFITKNIKKGKPVYGKIKLRVDESNEVYPNITKAKKLLNWKPKIGIKKGIIRTINSFKRDLIF